MDDTPKWAKLLGPALPFFLSAAVGAGCLGIYQACTCDPTKCSCPDCPCKDAGPAKGEPQESVEFGGRRGIKLRYVLRFKRRPRGADQYVGEDGRKTTQLAEARLFDTTDEARSYARGVSGQPWSKDDVEPIGVRVR